MKTTAIVYLNEQKKWNGKIETRNKAIKGKKAEVATMNVCFDCAKYTIAEKAIQLKAKELGIKIDKWVK